VLAIAAIAEAATGLALMFVPSMVGRLLLGEELAGVAVPVARILGIALLALGVGCWPGSTALCGMLTYNALGALYFLYLAVRGQWLEFDGYEYSRFQRRRLHGGDQQRAR